VRSKAEFTLQFTIVKDLKYDAERNYDFAHTISQKHEKDLMMKLYKRFLNKFDMKLLTKKPKSRVLLVDGGEICINHETFDKELKRSTASLLRKLLLCIPKETKNNIQRLF
jgi:hypothetical protein